MGDPCVFPFRCLQAEDPRIKRGHHDAKTAATTTTVASNSSQKKVTAILNDKRRQISNDCVGGSRIRGNAQIGSDYALLCRSTQRSNSALKFKQRFDALSCGGLSGGGRIRTRIAAKRRRSDGPAQVRPGSDPVLRVHHRGLRLGGRG